jgi:GT2 family glycosyltransferase
MPDNDDQRPPRRAAAGTARPSAGDGRFALLRRAAARLRERFDALAAQQAALEDSAGWRTILPALRAWMSPGSLGRGRTVLDDLAETRAGLAADLRALESELAAAAVPAQVTCEQSEGALDGDHAISILVTNWNGADAVDTLLESYARHHAPETAEFVIVDHASTDDSRARIRRWMDRLPITLLCCDRNQRYATANNLARRYASGSVLVFANNDIVFDEPLVPLLAAALSDPDAGLAGVPLYYPEDGGARGTQLQHAGIRFAWDATFGFMRPFNVKTLDPGEDGPVEEAAAVTTALAACRAEDFDAVGGFVEDYDYGFEDVELGLALRFDFGRRNLLLRGAGAVHTEFGSQSRQDPDAVQERRDANARLLRRRRGAAVARAVAMSQLAGGCWHGAALDVRLPPGVEPDEARPGLEAEEGPPGSLRFLDAAAAAAKPDFAGAWLMAEPEELVDRPGSASAVTVGLVAAGTGAAWLAAPGARHLDLLLCESPEDREWLRTRTRAVLGDWPAPGPVGAGHARSAVEAVADWLRRPGLAIRIAAGDEEGLEAWGDFHFAEALGRALRDRGYRVRTDIRPDWDTPRYPPDDVVLVLRGLEAGAPEPGPLRLAWLISHPDRVSDTELEGYDHVFVASDSHAARLDARLDTPVSALLQCTDPDRFPFVEAPDRPERVLFVGNAKGYYRPVVKAAIEAGVSPELWGTWWHEHLDESMIRGETVPNDELGALYGASGVVLNDHWPDMARLGFLSNRLFDAAATGALVVTDPVRGLEEVFGDGVIVAPVSPEGLRFPPLDPPRVADRAGRAELAHRIARDHSFATRAAVIDGVVRESRPGLFAGTTGSSSG